MGPKIATPYRLLRDVTSSSRVGGQPDLKVGADPTLLSYETVDIKPSGNVGRMGY